MLTALAAALVGDDGPGVGGQRGHPHGRRGGSQALDRMREQLADCDPDAVAA